MSDFVVLATADWDHPLWTNKQHVAVALADLGHRVLYVDSLGVRGPRVDRSDMGRILRRLRRGLRLPRKVRSGVWVVSPLVLPGQSRGLQGRFNRWSLNFSLFLADCVLDLRRPLLWTFNPQTLAYLGLKRFHAFQAAVYFCVDRIQAQPGMPVQQLEDAERDLCAQASALFTTSPKLLAALGPLNAGSHGFGNVADADHFGQALTPAIQRPDDWPQTNGPVLVFIGAIDSYKLDLSMLEVLMERTPYWTYLLIGPVGEADPSTDVSSWRRFENVHLLGTRDYSALPAYLAYADVALLPLQLNEYTRHMYPMKFFEYLAAGRPVVATAIPSLQDQSDVALLCPPDAVSFEAAIRCALAGEGPTLEQRLRRAGLQTYRTRTEAMLDCLDRHGLMPDLPLAPQAPPLHRVRAQFSRRKLSAQFCLLGLRLLELLGCSEMSQHILGSLLAHQPTNITLLSALARKRLAVGDHSGGSALIERIWHEDGVVDVLHQLLFHRHSRPGGRNNQLHMFEALASSTALPLHYAGYCTVVSTYLAMESNDSEALSRGVDALGNILVTLQADPDLYRCLKQNHENRVELLMSAQLARLRALIALQDTQALHLAAIEVLAMTCRYDPFAIDCTTVARSMCTIMRSLTVAAVMAWHAEDASCFDHVVNEMERLSKAFHAERFDHVLNESQASHRQFADGVVAMLQSRCWSSEDVEVRPELEWLVAPLDFVDVLDYRYERSDRARSFLQSLRHL